MTAVFLFFNQSAILFDPIISLKWKVNLIKLQLQLLKERFAFHLLLPAGRGTRPILLLQTGPSVPIVFLLEGPRRWSKNVAAKANHLYSGQQGAALGTERRGSLTCWLNPV